MEKIEIINSYPTTFNSARLEEALPRNLRLPPLKLSFLLTVMSFIAFAVLEIYSYSSPYINDYLHLPDLDIVSQKIFGLFLISFGAFFMQWIIDFYFLCESRPAIFLSKKDGSKEKIYFLDFGGARRARVLDIIYKQHIDISPLYGLFDKSTSSKLLPMRLGLDAGMFSGFISQQMSNRKEIKLGREEILQKLTAEADISDSAVIGAKEFMMLLYGTDENFSKFLFDNNIREKELRGAIQWIASYLASGRESSRWWEKKALGRIPGIGKGLGFGFTFKLDQYSRDVSLNESLGIRYLAHKKTIAAIEDILARSGEANVILVGEEGAGKQTILSNMARMISEGKIMPELDHKRMVILDTASITSSMKIKSDMEALLIKIMNEATSAGNIILVIDNFSDFLTSASSTGTDVLSIIEPYLAGAHIQAIALSDLPSYHRHLEQNGKISKLFQKVEIPAPTEKEILPVLENAAEVLERRSGLVATIQAIEAAYDLAERFVPEGAMPEKAIDLLDQAMSGAHDGSRYLLPQDIENIIQTQTNIPLGQVGDDESKKLLELENILHKRIVGQQMAVKGLADAMRRLRAGLHEGKRPIGSFLFLGPTGVGKTETAKALAEAYFNTEKNMTRFDMSEYHGDDGIKKLIGSFDSQEPGLLANALREKPFCVLLFDEFEKASKEVVNLFLQILDEGFITDAYGKKVSTRDAIIIATSNACSNLIWDMLKKGKDPSSVKDEVIDTVRKDGLFSPELLNRFDDIVIFHPLAPEHLNEVAKILLEDFAKRLKEKDITFIINQGLIDQVALMGYEPLLGARPMRRVITDKVEQIVAKMILEKRLTRGGKVELTADDLKNLE